MNPQKTWDFYILYMGIASRFSPEDIKYFYDLTDFEKATKNHNKIEDALGFGPGFWMAPHRTQQLIDGIIAQKQNKKVN